MFKSYVEDEQEFSDTIREIRAKLTEREPEHLPRFDDVVKLRGTLMDYIDSLAATIESYNPDNPGPESVYGDSILEETIELMRTLPTIPADIRNYVDDDWPGWKNFPDRQPE